MYMQKTNGAVVDSAGGNPPMKSTQRICRLVLLVGLAVSSACFAQSSDNRTSVAQIQEETRELLQALKTYTAAQRDEAIQKIKTAQINLDRRIEVLEKKIAKSWEETDQTTRDRSLATLQALRQQRTQVAEYYGSLKTSSTAAWGHFKEGFSTAYGELHKAWQKAEKEFAGDK
ncbi:MAG: hypothetical protein ACI9KN_000573 [Gammaproteobacteria bacterium]|jgi:hypothetical protein